MNRHLKYLLILNTAMVFISTSGPLGRYINLPPPLTIACRATFAMVFLGLFCWFRKYPFRFSIKEHGMTVWISGLLMAAHWVTYFYALQWANVAIAMLTLFAYPIITTLLEPIFFKIKYQISHLFLSIVIIIGILFLVPDLDMENSITQGLIMGLVSALCYALRNILLKSKIEYFNGSILMFYQMAITAIVLIPVYFYFPMEQDALISALPYILFLGLFTTAFGHTLFLNSFRYFSVSTASILSSMQPIYGIIMAIIFIHEYPEKNSIIGGSIILSAVMIESLLSNKKNKSET